MKKGLIAKSAFKKYQSGHPWLVANDILKKEMLPKRPCAFFFGEHWWLHSPESFLRLRRLGPPQRDWMKSLAFNTLTNPDHFEKHFGPWILDHLRKSLIGKIKSLNLSKEERCLRWIFSENDYLPGLIVDIFQNKVVAQINSAPIELFWNSFRSSLIKSYQEVFSEDPQILELRNSPVRKKEGLEIIENEPLSPQIIFWNEFRWQMTPAQMQKTGAYFDQRDNHRLAAEWAKRIGAKSAWDLCCYQGGFSLHLLKAGAQVIAVDQSQMALDRAISNVELNDLPKKNFTTISADIFEWLDEAQSQKKSCDLIVLDPPSFVKNREAIPAAVRAYENLNIRGLQCLNMGGILISCVCSHHISRDLYRDILNKAALKAKVKIEILEVRGPSIDHSPVLEFPEGNYLHSWFLRKMS